MQERIYRGDKDAQYWSQIDQLDKDRYQAEVKLLNAFFNPAQNPEFRQNGRYVLQQEFNKITSYIKTQYKILKYHQKNNNPDAILTVSESIKVMESFKRKF